MFDFLPSWTGWLFGGTLTLLIAALLAYALGARELAAIVASFLRPIVAAIGGALGNAITFTYENTRDGLVIIGRSGKALFALLVVCSIVAASVYVPTKKATERKTWAKAHKDYTLVSKRKAPARAAKTDSRSITLRNFMR